jgi:hypothetical protein
MCWVLCAALVAPVIVACSGCDRRTDVAPAQWKTHMADKDKKEKGTGLKD